MFITIVRYFTIYKIMCDYFDTTFCNVNGTVQITRNVAFTCALALMGLLEA